MSSNDNKGQAILLVTDKDSPVIQLQYKALKEATQKNTDVFIVYHQKGSRVPLFIENMRHFIFTDHILTRLGFTPICEKLIPGSNHFPLLQFYRENPAYRHYWVIEDDVRFNGDWKHFFDTFSTLPGDFFTCRICHWEEEQDWYWWVLVHPYKDVPLYKRIRSFNPIYRLSNIALQFLNIMLSDGWIGHHEVLIPTLLKYGGYHIYDFGGSSKYVLPGFENKFYNSAKPNPAGLVEEGTMRFRPVFDAIGTDPGKLYHPVKDFGLVIPDITKSIRFHSSVLKMIRLVPPVLKT